MFYWVYVKERFVVCVEVFQIWELLAYWTKELYASSFGPYFPKVRTNSQLLMVGLNIPLPLFVLYITSSSFFR